MTMLRELSMDAPVEHSLLDGAQGLIGQPIDRIEGHKKVAGRATYTAEWPIENVAIGYFVQAPFGCGTVTAIDAERARAMAGVIEVVTDELFLRNPQQGGATQAPAQGATQVRYFRQPIALVVAESYEQARAAGEAIEVAHRIEPGRYDFAAHLGEAERPEKGVIPAAVEQGDVDAAFDRAAVKIDSVWTTASESNAPMEPHASIALWEGDSLILYGSYQMLASCKAQLADALNMAADKVRIVSPYVGGGFGSKLGIAPETVASAIAARRIGRPVKTVMTRQQVFDATIRRTETRQHIRLGADAEGRIHAIEHATICTNLPGESFFEPAGASTRFLYRGEHRRVTHDIVHLNRLLAGSMRAPGEAAGMLALEGAMDELAEACGIDPVELRRRNDPSVDPEKGVPYSSRHLGRCLDEGARRFGWDARNRTPGSRREGEWLIGHGMAVASRTNRLMKSAARVALRPDGTSLVETDMTDIGTGTYTILAQIAGEMLGLPAERVEVRLGDNRYPPAAGSGGSFGGCSSGTSVYLACEALRDKLAQAMEADPDHLTLKDGEAIAGNRRRPIGELVGGGLSARGEIAPGKTDEATTQAAYGAHFCEVRVNAVTGETRVARWVSSFDAGRILNEKTARSQCLGGIVFGIGAALTEELILDPRSGKVVNRDLAEYHLPVSADVPMIEVVFLDARDPYANPLQAKGIGELGISGAGAAIANAIYNATGCRIRDYPITLDRLLPGLPPV